MSDQAGNMSDQVGNISGQTRDLKGQMSCYVINKSFPALYDGLSS